MEILLLPAILAGIAGTATAVLTIIAERAYAVGYVHEFAELPPEPGWRRDHGIPELDALWHRFRNLALATAGLWGFAVVAMLVVSIARGAD